MDFFLTKDGRLKVDSKLEIRPTVVSYKKQECILHSFSQDFVSYVLITNKMMEVELHILFATEKIRSLFGSKLTFSTFRKQVTWKCEELTFSVTRSELEKYSFEVKPFLITVKIR